MTTNQIDFITRLPTSNEFAAKIETCIQQSQKSARPFVIFIVNISHLGSFEKRRSRQEMLALLRDVGQAVRQVVHPSQFVGYFQDGLGLVFDAVDPGMVDKISQRLVVVIQNTLRQSHYNDFDGRLSDLVYHFMHPGDPGIVYPRVGWAVYPRDGESINQLVARAEYLIQKG